MNVLWLRNLTITAADTIDAHRRDAQEMQVAAVGIGDELALFHATFHQTGPALELGDVTAVAGLLDRADSLARRLAQPHLIWLVSFSRAGLAIMLGDLDDAEEQVQAAVALGVAADRRMEARAFGAEQITEIRRLQGRLGELGEGLRRAAPHLDPVHATLRYLAELDPNAPGLGRRYRPRSVSRAPPGGAPGQVGGDAGRAAGRTTGTTGKAGDQMTTTVHQWPADYRAARRA